MSQIFIAGRKYEAETAANAPAVSTAFAAAASTAHQVTINVSLDGPMMLSTSWSRKTRKASRKTSPKKKSKKTSLNKSKKKRWEKKSQTKSRKTSHWIQQQSKQRWRGRFCRPKKTLKPIKTIPIPMANKESIDTIDLIIRHYITSGLPCIQCYVDAQIHQFVRIFHFKWRALSLALPVHVHVPSAPRCIVSIRIALPLRPS